MIKLTISPLLLLSNPQVFLLWFLSPLYSKFFYLIARNKSSLLWYLQTSLKTRGSASFFGEVFARSEWPQWLFRKFTKGVGRGELQEVFGEKGYQSGFLGLCGTHASGVSRRSFLCIWDSSCNKSSEAGFCQSDECRRKETAIATEGRTPQKYPSEFSGACQDVFWGSGVEEQVKWQRGPKKLYSVSVNRRMFGTDLWVMPLHCF